MKSTVQQVPTRTLERYRYCDCRSKSTSSRKRYRDLKEDVARTGKFNLPVTLTFYLLDRKLLLTDGNHRLGVALELGHLTVPTVARVLNRRAPKGLGAPAQRSRLPDKPGPVSPHELLSTEELY